MRQQRHKNFSSYFMCHIQAGLNGLGQLSRTPMRTLFIILALGIILALPMMLYILMKNTEILYAHMQANTQLTLYLKQNVTEAQALRLTQALKLNPAIQHVSTISPAKGLKEFQQQTGIDNVLTDLQDNPIPWTIVVVPAISYRATNALATLSQSLKQFPEVDFLQWDTQWVERLSNFLQLIYSVTYAVAVFLGLAVLFVVSHCMQLMIQQNKKEIDIIQLVGGTRHFIRRPYLYAGILYGLLSGIMAWELVDLLMAWIMDPANHLAALFHGSFKLVSLNLSESLLLLISSIVIGLLGGWLAIHLHFQSQN